MVIEFRSEDVATLGQSELARLINKIYRTLGLEPLIPDDLGQTASALKIEVRRVEEGLRIGDQIYPIVDRPVAGLKTVPSWLAPHVERLSRQLVRSLKKVAGGGVTKVDRHILREVFRALAEHPRKDISLRSLSALCYRTPGYLGTSFQTFSGFSFRELLSIIRVKLVWDGLLSGTAMASEQGFNSGFGSVSQLNRSFKRVTGLTPTSVSQPVDREKV